MQQKIFPPLGACQGMHCGETLDIYKKLNSHLIHVWLKFDLSIVESRCILLMAYLVLTRLECSRNSSQSNIDNIGLKKFFLAYHKMWLSILNFLSLIGNYECVKKCNGHRTGFLGVEYFDWKAFFLLHRRSSIAQDFLNCNPRKHNGKDLYSC